MGNVKLTGMDDLRRALKRAGPLATEALAGAAVTEQEKVITAAKRRTPVDTGTLRASGTVLPARVMGQTVEVIAGFGGPASEYAVFVHENLNASHPVGEAKFLERPFLEAAPNMPRNMADSVEAALRRLEV